MSQNDAWYLIFAGLALIDAALCVAWKDAFMGLLAIWMCIGLVRHWRTDPTRNSNG